MNGFQYMVSFFAEIWRLISSIEVPGLGMNFDTFLIMILTTSLGIIVFKRIFMGGGE